MSNEKTNKIICILTAVLMTVLMCACSNTQDEDFSKRTENEEKVLRAMIEYPGEGLYDPVEAVIGQGTAELTEKDYAAQEEKAAKDKLSWEAAVGDCFAEGMFDTFYGKWYREYVIGIAYSADLTSVMSNFSIEDDDGSDNLEHVISTIIFSNDYGDSMSFDMDWRVKFDREDHNLLQTIELMDDGGLWESIIENS